VSLPCEADGWNLEAMSVSRFHIRLQCACGETSEFESLLARPGGIASIPCKCGRSFSLEQRDERMVTRISVDPLGITDGEIPQDLKLPKVH